MYPRIACPRRGIITLVAFVWFFTTVNFQMCPQKICPWGRIFTSIAFVWLFSGVRFQTLPQIACLRRCTVTLVAFVRLFSSMSFQMNHQIVYVRRRKVTFSTLPTFSNVDSTRDHLRDFYLVKKTVQKNSGKGNPPPKFGQCPNWNVFLVWMSSLRDVIP